MGAEKSCKSPDVLYLEAVRVEVDVDGWYVHSVGIEGEEAIVYISNEMLAKTGVTKADRERLIRENDRDKKGASKDH